MTNLLAIETHELTRRFGPLVAVDSLELRVPRGSIYGFLGPNGAGKTTTVRLLLGLLRPTVGEILLQGESYSQEKRGLLRGVGALVETPSLYPHLTGKENLEVTRRILDVAAARVEEALHLVDLTSAACRLVQTYSLGMRQRLALALAWLGKPRLLILDEPANGLDPAGIRDLRRLLRSLAREHQVTIFLSSHDLSEVEQIADWIGIIHRGRLVFQGELQDLKYQQQMNVGVDRRSDAFHLLKAEGWKVFEDSSDRNLSVQISSNTDAASVNRLLVENGIHVYELQRRQDTLEDLFLHLVSASEKGATA